jgi:hypothetical protein
MFDLSSASCVKMCGAACQSSIKPRLSSGISAKGAIDVQGLVKQEVGPLDDAAF